MGLGRVKTLKTLIERWQFILFMAGIFLAAAWLRIFHLGYYSLWQDECYTWFFTHFSLPQMLAVLRLDGVHPPFYYLLEKLFIVMSGDGAGGIRILSVIVDLISIFLVMWLGWQVSGPVGGLVAGWFWAFNPFTIWYAQDARPYAMAALFAALAFILIRKAQIRQTPSLMWMSGLALTLGLVTHFFFFLIVGALILLAWLQIRRSPRLFRRWTVISLIAMLPMGLWLVWFFMLQKPSIGIGWIPIPSLIDPLLTVWNFLSGFGGILSLPAILFGSLAGFFVLSGLIYGKQARENRRLFVVGILLPLLLTWLVSFRRPVYVDRYFIVLIPFLIPILASGGRWASESIQKILPAQWTWILIAVILAGTGLMNAWQVHTDIKYRREDWSGLIAYLSAQHDPKPSIWFLQPESAVPFEYYYRGSYQVLESKEPPACTTFCWWIIRQPYTATHAFTQSIPDPGRPWIPELPSGCTLLDRWDSPTGIGLWRLSCP